MKKTTKGLLSALLLTAMCGAVGCKPVETSTGTPSTGTSSSTVVNVEAQNLLSSIVDNGDGCYTVSEADGKTTVAFNKPAGKEWAAASIDVSGIANKDRMSTLRFKVSGVGKLLIKFEGDNGACEIGQFVIFDTESKYEWSLLDNSEILAGAKKLLFFAQPGGTGEGQFTLSELTLTPDVAGDDTSYQIITNNYTNIKEGSNVYDGAASTFHFNNYWTCNDGDVHTFTEENGAIKVDWSKNPDLDRSWAFAKTPISGAFGKFNYINFKVKGTSGQSVMFKAEAAGINKEVKIIFDGNEQIYTLDLSEYTDTQRQGMAQILMFAAPGEASGSGTYYILDAYFSNTFDGANVARPVNQYNGTDSSFGINQHWHDGGDGVYNVTSEASPWVVEYNKGNNEYPALKTLVAGKFGNFTKIRFGVKVDEGKTIMIKAANGCEVTVTGTGAYDDSYELDLTTLSEAQRDAITEVIVFAEPGAKNVSGSFEIHWMMFDGFQARQEIPTHYYNGTDNSFGCNDYWFDGGDSVYTVASDASPWVVNYTKGAGHHYSSLKTKVNGLLGNFSTLKFGVKVEEGKKIMIKAANGCEVTVTGTGAYDDSYSLDLSGLTVAQRNAITEIIIFAAPGEENVSGSFEIHWMSFNDFAAQDTSTTNVYDGTSGSFGCNAHWYSGDPGVYTTEGTGPVVVNYTKAKDQTYPALKTNVVGKLGNFKTLNFGVLVPEGKEIIIKVAHIEVRVTGTGEYDGSYSLDLSSLTVDQRNAIREVLIMAEPGTDNVSGTFEIHWMSFNA